LGGVFLPRDGYIATAPDPLASDDFIYLVAGNVAVRF
jgi:hypothetical protein